MLLAWFFVLQDETDTFELEIRCCAELVFILCERLRFVAYFGFEVLVEVERTGLGYGQVRPEKCATCGMPFFCVVLVLV